MSWHLDAFTWYPKSLPSDTILSRTVRRWLNLPTAFPSSAYHFWVTSSTDKNFMRGIMARPTWPLLVDPPGLSLLESRLFFFVNE